MQAAVKKILNDENNEKDHVQVVHFDLRRA